MNMRAPIFGIVSLPAIALATVGALSVSPIQTFAQSSSSAPNTLYYRLKEVTEHGEAREKSERAVERYIPMIFYSDQVPGVAVEEKHVDLALDEKYQELCEREGSASGGSAETELHLEQCNDTQQELTTLTERTMFLRSLGRDLALIASGYEAGILGHPGEPVSVLPKLGSLAGIWRAGNDTLTDPVDDPPIRAREHTSQSAFERRANTVKSALEALIETSNGKEDKSKMIAAIWRYRHGIRFVQESEGLSCSANPQAGSERELLKARWCAVEQALINVHNGVPSPLPPMTRPCSRRNR